VVRGGGTPFFFGGFPWNMPVHGLVQIAPLDQALAFYREAGFEPVEDGELADHLAYELSFMALLLEEGKLDLLGRFLSEHFLRWYPRFLSALKQADPRPFYWALGDLVLAITNRLREEVSHEKTRLS